MDKIINLDDQNNQGPDRIQAHYPSSHQIKDSSDGFVEVKRRRNRVVRVGTADASCVEPDAYFEGSASPHQKRVWVFLKKVKDDVNPDRILKFLTSRLNTVRKTFR
nr:unnamed protein product [Callosobruchus analis]